VLGAFGIRGFGMIIRVLRVLLGLGGVLLALGMVILAMRIGSSTMGLRCGFVMFRRLVVCVFHFDFSVGRKISAVNSSRLNSGRIEGQSYFKSREPSSIIASSELINYRHSLCFGFGSTATAALAGSGLPESRPRNGDMPKSPFTYWRRWCHRLAQS
jgi:hypothetical protein